MTVEVYRTPEALAVAAAEAFVAAAADAIKNNGAFHVALAGGSTPKQLYALLATELYANRVVWSRVHVYWGDERCVPPTDSASNYRMAREALLDNVPIPASNIHRIRGEVDPTNAAAEYELTLAASLDERFDLVLLGLGNDGHTASLFPGSGAVHEQEQMVVAEYVVAVSMWRVTLTLAAINEAARVWFLVAGEEKAEILQRVLEGPPDLDELPAQRVDPPEGELRWFVDPDAAARLERV